MNAKIYNYIHRKGVILKKSQCSVTGEVLRHFFVSSLKNNDYELYYERRATFSQRPAHSKHSGKHRYPGP